MLRPTLIACALIASACCFARPMVIHQSQALEPPAGSGYQFFGYQVAIDGDWAIVIAGTPSPTTANPQQTHDALLYRRVNGTWTFDRILVRRVQSNSGQYEGFGSVAMNNGVAAIGSNPTQVFRRNGNTWMEIAHPFAAPRGDPDAVEGELIWDGNTLLAAQGDCNIYDNRPWGALISRLNANGTWSAVERLSSGDTYCNQWPMTWGISGNTVVTGTWTSDYELAPEQLRIFRRSGSTWIASSAIEGGDGEGGVRGDEIFFSSRGPGGTQVYRNDDSQTVIDNIRTVSTSYGNDIGRAFNFIHTGDVFVQDLNVFRKNAAGRYEHVAMFVPHGLYTLDYGVKINGRHAIAAGWRDRSSANQVVLFFDLPETITPSPVIATGFAGSAAAFEPQLGAFDVVTTPGGNRVYRQSSLAGDYRALVGGDWTSQSIEADIKPTAFSGSNRWAGMAVRYLDASNYYYVTLRSSGLVELKLMRNGVHTTVAQKALPIVAGRSYHVALQSFSTLLWVLVDGKQFIWWEEPNPIPHGRSALLGYRTAVDYDNVVASQVGQRPILDMYACYGAIANMPVWTTSGGGEWNCSSSTGANIMRQSTAAGDARAVGGTPTDDQVVTARARSTSFAATPGANQWFGLAARYRDASNYYYLTVRNSNSVSLRKLVNGAITVLGTATLTVQPNAWYDPRLDAVGNELRAFVDGVQVLQATDSSHASGQGGMLSYNSATEYTNYFAWQP